MCVRLNIFLTPHHTEQAFIIFKSVRKMLHFDGYYKPVAFKKFLAHIHAVTALSLKMHKKWLENLSLNQSLMKPWSGSHLAFPCNTHTGGYLGRPRVFVIYQPKVSYFHFFVTENRVKMTFCHFVSTSAYQYTQITAFKYKIPSHMTWYHPWLLGNKVWAYAKIFHMTPHSRWSFVQRTSLCAWVLLNNICKE